MPYVQAVSECWIYLLLRFFMNIAEILYWKRLLRIIKNIYYVGPYNIIGLKTTIIG
jgi:hypothetical protein